MRLRTDRAEASALGTATGLSLDPSRLAVPLKITDSAVLNAVTGPTRIFLRGAHAAAGEEELGDAHPVVAGVRAMLDHFDAPQVGVQLHLEIGVPRARGLGSTSTDLVLGALLACQLVGEETAAEQVLSVVVGLGADALRARSTLSDAALLRAEGEDIPIAISSSLSLVAFVPDFPAGPDVDLTDRPTLEELGAESARAGALLLAITGSGEGLMQLSKDVFGLAAREPSVPASVALIGWLRQSGVPAVLSGSGPSVISLTPVSPEIRAAAEKSGWRVLDVL